MKHFARSRFAFLAVVVAGLAPVPLLAQPAKHTIQIETTKSVAQVSELLPGVAKKHGYGVVATHDMTATLASKGHPIDRTMVIFELCKATHAQSAIDISPVVATVLPCRIAVWENNGRTILAMVKPAELLALAESSKEMREIAGQVEQELQRVMSEVASSKK